MSRQDFSAAAFVTEIDSELQSFQTGGSSNGWSREGQIQVTRIGQLGFIVMQISSAIL